MLTRIIDFSLAHRGAVLLAALAVAALGVASFLRLPFDAYPDTTPVQVHVNAVGSTLSPLEIERQVAFPIEQAISGLPGLEEVRSVSKFGYAQIVATFEDGTDIWLARQAVSERLAAVDLPEGVGRPALGPVSTGLGEVFHYLVTSETRSPTELRTIQDWVIRPQLASVSGVAEINGWGGFEKQWHVQVDPDRLIAHGVDIEDVARALRRNNANTGGGIVSSGGEARIVQGLGLVSGREDIERIVVAAHDGVPVRILEVADVVEGHEVRRGAVTANGEGEAVLGLGMMLMGENSREVARALEDRLREVEPTLPDGVDVEVAYSRSELVSHVLDTVRTNLLEGALLVVAILFVFLGNFRAGLIVASAIPLSMLFAFDMMLRFGIAGSLMSLGAIDFGLVVDSSVIAVENAERRLAGDTSGRSVREIVRDACVEVRKPTLFGELIIAAVYLPVLALEGVEGKLFRPMALTVIFALAGSMILSLTVMPVLASFVLERRPAGKRRRVMELLERAYRPILDAALARPTVVLVAAFALLTVGALLAPRLGAEFVPRLREGSIVINTVRLAGVSLEESVRYGTQIERRLLDRFPDEIEAVWTRTGTAEIATDPMGLEVSDVFVQLTDRDEWKKASTQDALVERIVASLEGMPGMRAVYMQPIEMRVNEMIAGIRSDVGVKIFGDDFDQLRASADAIAARIEAIPGAADVTVEQISGLPLLQVEVDREAIARWAIDAEDVLAVVASLGPRVVGEVREEGMRFDLAVTLPDAYRDDPERIGRILVSAPGGERVPLAELAHIRIEEAPSTIQREWQRRRAVVQANVRGRDLASFVSDVQGAVGEVDLPEGWYVRYGGQFEHLERARARLAIVVPLALLLIAGLLWVTYRRWSDVSAVFVSIPFAVVGGVVLLFVRDIPFSISAAVGFIALSGVAVLGEMVLVSRLRHLLDEGMAPDVAIREAAMSRVRPVLMTALVASLGFLPMALNTGIGAEVQRPLATVVIGGIVTSTLTTLVFFPVLYRFVAMRRRRQS